MKKKQTYAVVAGTALLTVWVIVARLHTPTPSEAAVTILSAMENRDAAAMWPYISAEQRTKYDLTISKLQALLDRKASVGALTPEGKVRVIANPSYGSATSSRSYRLPNGEREEFQAEAIIGPDHRPFAPDLVGNLILTDFAIAAQLKGPTRGPQMFLNGLAEERPGLEALGFSGVIDVRTRQWISWTELATQFETRRQRYLLAHKG